MCKISIIMPVYNKEKYVGKAIESVLKQTFGDWELIIIDDGSTDSSLEVCRGYQDDRIKMIHSQNGGVSKARNVGLSRAQGDYVTFVDGDDYLSEDYLEQLYMPDYNMIIGGLTKVNFAGEALQQVLPEYTGEQSVADIACRFYQEQLTSGIYGFVAGKMIRRSIVEQFALTFDENIKLAEDYDFFLKVYSLIESIYFINSRGYFYVQETENSAIVLNDEKIDFFVQIEIQNKTRAFLENKKSFDKENERLYLERVTGYVYTVFINSNKLDYRDFCVIFGKLKILVPEVSKETAGLKKWYLFFYEKNLSIIVYILIKLRLFVGR